MKGKKSTLFSLQATKIYQLLLQREPLTAKDIANQLEILPHAVYRAVKQLIELGFVQENTSYPTQFVMQSQAEALDLYTMALRQNFQKTFPSKKNTNGTNIIDISFIQNREDLLSKTDEDIQRARKSVNFIVSGLEVPAETILTYKQAIDRGVSIRALVQNFNETSKEMFQNWKRVGVEVKYFPNMEARIFIIDEQIVYFTSYNSQKKEDGIGMRFNYMPYANLMSETFEQRWESATLI